MQRMLQIIGRLFFMGALVLVMPGCCTLIQTSRYVDNIGTTYERITPTGKIMKIGSASYLQLSSRVFKDRVFPFRSGGCHPKNLVPLSGSFTRLVYAKLNDEEKRAKWYEIRKRIDSGEKTLIPEEQLRPRVECMGWETFDLSTGIWEPARKEVQHPFPGDPPGNPLFREKHSAAHYLTQPLAFPAVVLDGVVTLGIVLPYGIGNLAVSPFLPKEHDKKSTALSPVEKN